MDKSANETDMKPVELPPTTRTAWAHVSVFDKAVTGFYDKRMKVVLTPHQEKFVAMKMSGGGYLSADEVVREALRVYERADLEDDDPELAEALRAALRSPRRPYRRGHFAALARSVKAPPLV